MESCVNVKCYCYHYLVTRASRDILITVTRKKIKLNGFPLQSGLEPGLPYQGERGSLLWSPCWQLISMRNQHGLPDHRRSQALLASFGEAGISKEKEIQDLVTIIRDLQGPDDRILFFSLSGNFRNHAVFHSLFNIHEDIIILLHFYYYSFHSNLCIPFVWRTYNRQSKSVSRKAMCQLASTYLESVFALPFISPLSYCEEFVCVQK